MTLLTPSLHYDIQAPSTKAVEMDCIVPNWNIYAIFVLHPDASLIPKLQ